MPGGLEHYKTAVICPVSCMSDTTHYRRLQILDVTSASKHDTIINTFSSILASLA
jgi:hypothetical protein